VLDEHKESLVAVGQDPAQVGLAAGVRVVRLAALVDADATEDKLQLQESSLAAKLGVRFWNHGTSGLPDGIFSNQKYQFG
jgi:hypothetical protein